MTKPMLLSEFTRLPPAMRATAFDGLSALIDAVAEQADEGYRFLRYQWFAAAIAALHAGRARTDGIITHRFPLDQYGKALDALANDRTAHKIVLVA